MKRVNFDPELELKKVRIMQEFNQNNGPEAGDHSGHNLQEKQQLNQEIEVVEESELRERVIDALKTVYDPEIPVNIYDLGLIYEIRINDQFVDVDMTLTAPGCPVAHTFPGMVERSVALVPGVRGAAVELIWEPPWTQDLISEAARLELGLI
jgi:FeS assembly SUF system protein